MVAGALVVGQGAFGGANYLGRADGVGVGRSWKPEAALLTGNGSDCGSATPIGHKQPYEFGRTTFYKEIYLGNGGFFSDVSFVELEMITVGEFQLYVVDANGRTISASTGRGNEHGGWHTFDFSSGMNPPVHRGTYRIKLINRSEGAKVIKHGKVNYQ